MNASSLAQAQVVKVLEGDTTRLETTGGNVVLDLHPLVVQLGDRFGFLGNVSETLPPDAGRITILRSDELDTAQSLTQALKIVANWIWIPALLAWAAALWLVPGRRRKEVRAISIGLIVAGVAILVIRRVAGSYLVDNLTDSESIRPAVDAFWTILSDGLAEAAWVGVVVGVIGALGTWLTGEGERAVATRRDVAPLLARTGAAWAVFAGILLLVIWALPLHRFVTTAILVVLAAVGFEVFRRQALAEQAAEGPGALRAGPTIPWPRSKGPTGPTDAEELERLARLRADDLLTEEEYAAAKGRLLGVADSRYGSSSASPGARTRTSTSGALSAAARTNASRGSARKAGSVLRPRWSGAYVPQWIGTPIRGRSRASASAALVGVEVRAAAE